MQSHFVLLIVFSFFVSLIFAFLTKDDLREQIRFGGLMFAGFIATADRARLVDVPGSLVANSSQFTVDSHTGAFSCRLSARLTAGLALMDNRDVRAEGLRAQETVETVNCQP